MARDMFSSNRSETKVFILCIIGLHFQAVQQQILQLLTPVTMNHTIVFLASLADVWYQRRRREGSGIKATRAIPLASEEQIIVVDIVYAIKVEYLWNEFISYCKLSNFQSTSVVYWRIVRVSIYQILKNWQFLNDQKTAHHLSCKVGGSHTRDSFRGLKVNFNNILYSIKQYRIEATLSNFHLNGHINRLKKLEWHCTVYM